MHRIKLSTFINKGIFFIINYLLWNLHQNIPHSVETGKTPVIRRVRVTDVIRHHGGRIENPPEAPRTFTALSY